MVVMNRADRVYVAGHRGLVGSAICRLLAAEGFTDVVTRTRSGLDLTNQADVYDFFRREQPAYVFLAAGRVGGILANSTHPAEFIRENLHIQINVIDAAYRWGAKLLHLGSSCIYPRESAQPINESALMTGPLEPTNEPYAMAKLAGLSMLRAYRRQYGMRAIALMPTNLYGPGDKFHPLTSHLVPALMMSAERAKREGGPMVVWGTGTPRRELMHVDDLARACLHFMRTYEGEEIVNVGTGEDATVLDIARLIADVVGHKGAIELDFSKPDGMPVKRLDVTRARVLGWSATIPLLDGLAQTYAWWEANR